MNNHLVLLGGKSAAGKSASLMNLQNPEGVMYLNCEAGKKLPFKSKFKEFVIVDPMQVYEAFEVAESKPEIHTIVVDTLTYLMDMYENLYVVGSSNTMKAWGDYGQYLKKLMLHYVAKSSNQVIFLAHTADVMNETDMIMETMVKVKGSVMNTGVESFFSTVLACKKMPLAKLKAYNNPLLVITPDDELLGYKYVFQTKLTKETVNERIRSSMGMWNQQETFIDNDAQLVLNRLREYYD